MLGFFEWISDEMSPPGDAYDPAVGRPQCKKCGKDAWLMWNGKYSAYCSVECRNRDKRKESLRSSVSSLLPSRDSRKPAKVSAFERAIAAKKAARDIKAIAEKWRAQKKKGITEDVYADSTQQKESESTGEKVRKGDSFVQQQADEAEFHKMQARLAQVAQALAQEHQRAQEERSQTSLIPHGTVQPPVGKLVARLSSSTLLSPQAAALEQAFAEELERQAEEEDREREREESGKASSRRRDAPQSAQAPKRASSSTSTHKEKTTEARMQTPDESGREGGNSHTGYKSQRRTENGEGHEDNKQQLDEKDFDRNCHMPTLAPTTASEPRAEYTHPRGHAKQPRIGTEDQRSWSDRAHIPCSHRWCDCTRRESEECRHRRTIGDAVHARKKRPHNEDTSSISLDSKQGDTPLRQLPEDLPFVYRHRTPAKPELPALSEAPCADRAKLDEHFPTKSRHSEGSYQHQFAKKHSSALLHLQQGDVASRSPKLNASELLRVAGASSTYITLDDLRQLRDAAWKETTMAMEEVCACWKIPDRYAGNLEVHLLSVENVNPSRVSLHDKLYVVVRCQVAETEWVEKRSKCVKNLRWDESLSFPVMYEKYPLRARVCVQLWRRASHQGDIDLFVGEGEVPFPRTVTRVALHVQLCWNARLGGNVVDLDCGRLHLVVHLVEGTHTGEANSTPVQEIPVSISGKETVDGRQQTTAFVQTRTSSKETHKATVRRRNISNKRRFRQAEPRKPARHNTYRKSARYHKNNLDIEAETQETAEGKADSKWRHVSSRPDASLAKTLDIFKNIAQLSPIKGSTIEDQRTDEPGDKESSRRIEVHRTPPERDAVRQENTAAATENEAECFHTEKEGHSLREAKRVSEDAETPGQQEKRHFYAHAAPVSPEALPISAVAHPGSEASAEGTITKRSSRSSESLACSSAEASTSIVSSGICGEFQDRVSNVPICNSGKRQTVLNPRPCVHGPAVSSNLPTSVAPHKGISEAELQVLLPVALAQMDDFAHYDAEPRRAAVAANLDPCVLLRPWCSGHEKWTHCANRSCRRVVSNRFMKDLFEEEEFRAWGCCSTCQGEMFHTKVPTSTNGDTEIFLNAGMYNEFTLESFIPLAFPTLSLIWPSSRHLYLAQRFTHVQIQDRLRQCRTQRELTFTLMAPLLKYFVRPDWCTYRHEALRTCIRLKIQQHPRLQLLLASTGQATLYDPSLPDFWEWEAEDEAVRANLVGSLLMELRKEYL